MKNILSIISVVLTSFSLQAASLVTEQPFVLPKGTMSVGGHVLVVPSFDGNLGHRLDVEIHPTFGYFLIDNLELQTGISIQATPASSAPELQGLLMPRWGIDAGLAYYFDCQKVFVYTAAKVGYRATGKFFDNTLDGTIAGGVLVPLTGSLALDFQVPFQLSYTLSGTDGVLGYRIPVGFAGIRGYF